MMDEVRPAPGRGEIAAHFQPIVRLGDRREAGFEALARWRPRGGGVVGPAGFVPGLVARGRGLDLAGRMAVQALEERARRGGRGFVSVNVAAADLGRRGLPEAVGRLVHAFRLPPGALVIEIGEDRLSAPLAAVQAAANAIRAAGAGLAVDDMGAGFADLARLTAFRVDMIKTDISLAVAADGPGPARRSLARIVAAARERGISVVAEGIEDEATARRLADLGCEYGQGFHFGAAKPARRA